MQKKYEMDNDYILDILEEEEDRLSNQLKDSLSEQMQFQFAKLLAVRNAIENINIKNAFENGLYTTNNKKII